MKGNHFIITATLSALSLVLAKASSTAPAHESPEMLWERANEIARTNRGWIPGRVERSEKVVSKKGMIEEDIQLVLEFSKSAGGVPSPHLLSYTSKGKDITAKTRKDAEKEALDSLLESLKESAPPPFGDIEAGEVRNHEWIADEPWRGVECAVFRFYSKGGKQDYQGKVWIDRVSGAAIRTQIDIVSAPYREGDLTILALRREAEYDHSSNGTYVMIREAVKVGMRLSMLLFTFEGNATHETRLSDHWRDS